MLEYVDNALTINHQLFLTQALYLPGGGRGVGLRCAAGAAQRPPLPPRHQPQHQRLPRHLLPHALRLQEQLWSEEVRSMLPDEEWG